MDSIVDQIKQLASASDEAGRNKIKKALEEVQISLDTRYDILGRVSNLPVQLSVARIAADQGIFNALVESKGPIKLDNFATTSGVAPELLGRILRYLASVNMVKETGFDEFTANAVTKALSGPDSDAVIYVAFDSLNLIFQELPDHLAELNYQEPTDPTRSAWQKAFKTVLPAYVWLPNDPRRYGHGHRAKMAQRMEDWISSFPVEKEIGDWSAEPEKALFVDIGGGGGHQCFGFRAKYPNIPGRVIVQDTPTCISLFKPSEGVEAMAYDFYTPQPIKGAKFYYLRNIMHDYPDDHCVKILQNIIPALDNDSRILIDEMVLSNSGVHWRSAAIDMTMMASLAAKERTRDQWYALLDCAGLKVLYIHTYSVTVESAVIVAVPK